MKSVVTLVLVVALTGSVLAVPPERVAEYLQKTSVNVKSNRSQGSGSVVLRKIDGEEVAFVITAAHVVDSLRTINTIIDKDGREKKVVSYRDAAVLQERIENGQTVGEVKVSCRVLAVTNKHDIAILQVRWSGLYRDGVEFDISGQIPPVGSELFHCGSPGGQDIGFNSLTDGILSASGRMIDMGHGTQPYDQITCSSLPGSSGGAVVRVRDGAYIGTLTLGLQGSDSFSWIVPVRRTIKWANGVGLGYILDPKVKALTRADIDRVYVEAGDDGKVSADTEASQPEGSVRKQIWPAGRQESSLFNILTHRNQ